MLPPKTGLVQTGEDPCAVALEALPERLGRRECHGERQVDGTERRGDVAPVVHLSELSH